MITIDTCFSADVDRLLGLADQFLDDWAEHAVQGGDALVDVAHDLGAMGEGGRGFIGQQGMTGQIDIVMGSFSKTFASNGGFVSCKSPAVKQYLKFYGCSATFSNALSPVQAATVTKAFNIVQSDRGREL